LYYAKSEDHFQTWPTQGYVYDFGPATTRLASCKKGDSIIVVSWRAVNVLGISTLNAFLFTDNQWDTIGLSLNFPADDSIKYLGRNFNCLIGRYNIVHIFCSDTADGAITGTNSRIHHWWLHPDSPANAWHRNVIHTSDLKEEDGPTNLGMRVMGTFSEYDQNLRVFYTSAIDGDNAIDRLLYCKSYNYSDQTWGSALTVSTEDSVKEISTAPYVAASHKSAAYSNYHWTTGSAGTLVRAQFVTVFDSNATAFGEVTEHINYIEGGYIDGGIW